MGALTLLLAEGDERFKRVKGRGEQLGVHSTGRRNIMDSHVRAGGTDAATKMAGAPERGGPGRAVATMAPGRTLKAIARALDRRRSVVQRVLAGTGGFTPVPRRRSARVLSLAER